MSACNWLRLLVACLRRALLCPYQACGFRTQKTPSPEGSLVLNYLENGVNTWLWRLNLHFMAINASWPWMEGWRSAQTCWWTVNAENVYNFLNQHSDLRTHPVETLPFAKSYVCLTITGESWEIRNNSTDHQETNASTSCGSPMQ